MNIRIMTYNIHHGEGMDKKVDLHRIANVIEESEADIIGLNEVDKHFSKRSHFQNQIYWLANRLKLKHAYSPSLSILSKNSSTAREYGNAILSKYPILTKKSHTFNYVPGFVEKRSMLDTTININGKLFQFMVTHMSLNRYFHAKQTNYIINHVCNAIYPVILLGDWNMKAGSKPWNKITNQLQDVWKIKGVGSGNTYPSLRPKSRIDYIFISSEIKLIDTEVMNSFPSASDHLPLIAKVTSF
ncbi:endonuclease/exonuclease/phosphatase family protein [Chengkuizengella axinellae]|uniref:Endonuclease/exonuclease/phosphatase family protein n=1 Tax=Chengkuizengella axinellae TaxID=3064388 RepID=A0ABT9IVZ9_9BACL|nr:endonuclease/exonuclease/phosphatase family protein [Chengkuizengella sp. 2205SS18-9]MDP5273536.1 endonuclease/exonuclease/phosphatase family protein [Chengkuizengella sp. 2205SS18-9]